MLPKSLNLFSRKEYGSTFNQINILYDWNSKSINLYSEAHSMPTKINDYLVNSFCKNLDVTTRTFEPYILFLNGEYWGFYWLMPRFEDEFFQMEYDIKEDEMIFIKCEEVEIGEEKDLALYHDMREYISSYDMNNITYFQQVKTIIDIDSFLDYYATEIYIANTDWPNNNFALWRSRYFSRLLLHATQ